MAVYLLHFDHPIARVRHYVGFAKGGLSGIERRLAVHRSGRGARITKAACNQGIGFVVSTAWPEGDQALERRIKKQKTAAGMCEICLRDRKIEGVAHVQTRADSGQNPGV